MKSRAVIAAELRQALRTIEMTDTFLDAVRTGSVTKEQLVAYLEAALDGALDQVFLDMAERLGGVPSVRQVAAAEGALLISEMATGSLPLVQDVAGRVKETWSDARLIRALRPAVLLSAKDEKAAQNYDDELRIGDPASKKRKLRDRRFNPTKKMSLAKRRLMVDRYRERLMKHRTASIARDMARSAEATLEYASWIDRAEAGDQEAVGARKFWDTLGDGHVRDAHVYVEQDYPDGIPLTESFATKYGPMRFPHDRQGDIRNWAGCRCKPRFKGASKLT